MAWLWSWTICGVYSHRNSSSMSCLCICPNSRRRTVFYWHNFSFARSQETVSHRSRSPKPRQHHQHHHHRHHLRRRPHSVAYLPRRRLQRSSVSRVTVMTDDYKPPPGPPPSYTARQQAATENGHHVSFAPSRHPGHPSEHNTQSAPPKSLNPFRRTHSPRQELSPSRPQQEETYLPPSGPPPSWQRHQANDEKLVVSNIGVFGCSDFRQVRTTARSPAFQSSTRCRTTRLRLLDVCP